MLAEQTSCFPRDLLRAFGGPTGQCHGCKRLAGLLRAVRCPTSQLRYPISGHQLSVGGSSCLLAGLLGAVTSPTQTLTCHRPQVLQTVCPPNRLCNLCGILLINQAQLLCLVHGSLDMLCFLVGLDGPSILLICLAAHALEGKIEPGSRNLYEFIMLILIIILQSMSCIRHQAHHTVAPHCSTNGSFAVVSHHKCLAWLLLLLEAAKVLSDMNISKADANDAKSYKTCFWLHNRTQHPFFICLHSAFLHCMAYSYRRMMSSATMAGKDLRKVGHILSTSIDVRC